MRFLVPHDGSEHSYKALDQAVQLADKLGGEASIHVVIVIPDLCLVDVGIDECNTITSTLYKEGQGIKAKIAETLKARGITADIQIKTGNSEAASILESAEEVDADFVVIGAAGKHGGGGRNRLGNVADKVVSRCDRNVLVVH